MLLTKVSASPLEVKAGAVGGTIEGYGSIFGNVDSYGEMVMPGAFTASLVAARQKGRKVKMLWQHDPDRPIGVWDDLAEDSKGLYVKGRILIESSAQAKEAHALIREGALDGLSIGYRLLESELHPDMLQLTKIDLKEVSTVTFAANDGARVTDVKATDQQVARAISWLKKAITLHEKHMNGTAPTTGPEGEASQKLMMDMMKRALLALDPEEPAAMPAMGKGIITVREFEEFLRDAGGFSKRLAAAIAAKATPCLRGDPDGEVSAAELADGNTATSTPASRGPVGPHHTQEETSIMAEEKTVDQLVDEVKARIDTARDEVKAIATDALGKAENGEKMSEDAKAKADEALTTLNELKAQFAELEQKTARRGEVQERPKSAGEQFIENDLVKAFMENPSSGKRVGLSVKAIISAATSLADGSAGDVLVPMRVPEIVMPANRRMTVRDLLTPGRTNQPSIQYAKETGFTNAAATVSEVTGPTKPQSDIQFDIVTTAVTTIAHWVTATKQILDDAPMLQSYIDQRLRYGLAYVEEQQLLNGSGTGTNLNGIYTQATAFAAGTTVIGASSSKIDVLRVAMLQVALSELEATGHVLHPRDWAEIELLKDSQNRYIIGDPQSTLTPRLWGLPVVPTTAMTAGNFLTGAFKMGAQLFDREDANVAISTEDANNFRQNLVTILAEERIGLAVYRPEAFIKGTYSTAITDLTS